jgi:hypothetical protein
MLYVIVLSAIMASISDQIVIMLSVVAPSYYLLSIWLV